MGITVERTGAAFRLALSGRLDERTARELELNLSQIAKNDPSSVEIDLQSAVSINSAVLSALLKFYRQLPGCSISLRNAPPHIYDMLVTVKLDRLFSISKGG